YSTVWRWHFYAGIIFAPFLIVLSVTGSIYLFKPQIEQFIYQEYYEVKANDSKLSPSRQLEIVKEQYPMSTATKYRPGEAATRSSEVTISENMETYTVFVDPYSGNILGKLNNKDKIMDKIEEIHGELMAGTIGDRLVELAACWTIVLIITGFYLWFPKKKWKLAGVFFPRFTKGKKTLQRDLHAVPAIWITLGMLFVVMTGLPWSGFWGTNFQNIVTNSGAGYPPSIWVGSAPASNTKTKEIAEVPWAAENLQVPMSTVQGYIPLSIDDVITIADRQKIYPGYTVIMPKTPEGVYTLSVFPPRAQDEATMHLDQYTGAVLADYRYDHYGPIGKIIAWGITLHKGLQFGLLNQLVGLVICLGIIFVACSGFYLWLKRKPAKTIGAPKGPNIWKQRNFLLLMTALSVLFPLVGVSIILVLLMDKLIIQRIPFLRKCFYA
ncbi:MAG: PepSY domain-containing protein, partial [Bacillus sp. (in: firmicutes)]